MSRVSGLPSQETILVVDDNPTTLQLLVEALSERGYEVQAAPSGFLALQFMQRKLPDLILLDLMIPNDGYEICRRFKADKQTGEVPVIFLSGSGESADRIRAFEGGCADYITKPFLVEEVIVRVENQLNLRRLQKQLIAKNDRLQQEIQEREKAQAALKESEERWHLVLLGNNDGIWDWDIASNQTIRSDRFAEVLGYEPHEISSRNEEWSDRIHPDDFDRVMAANEDYLQKKSPSYMVEHRLRCKDGHYKWVFNRGQAQWDEAGNPIRMVGSLRDISEAKHDEAVRKQAEAALRDGEVRYRLLSENSTDLISRHTLAGIFLDASPASRTLLGYEPEELVGRSIYDFFHPDDLAAAPQKAVGQPETATLSYRARCKNGSYIWLETKVRVVRSPELSNDQETMGKARSETIAVSRDITERKQAEDQLSQQLNHILLLQQITEAIRSQLDTQQIFETTVSQVGHAFKVSRCAILVHRNGSFMPLITVAEHREPGYASLLQIETPIVGNPYVIKVLEQGQAVSSPNLFRDPLLEPVADLYNQIGLKSMLAVRTAYQGQPNGIITLHQCDRFREWTTNEIELFEAIAAQVSIALAQANLLEKEQKQREALDDHNLILRAEILERRKADAALQASEAELRGLFAAMTDIVLVMDAEGRYLEIAPTNSANLYKPADALLGKTLAEVFPPGEASYFLGCIQQTLKAQQTLEFEYCMDVSDRSVWFVAKAAPISERAVVWVAHDITARKQAEAELRASEERWQLAIQGTCDGIADVDLIANEVFFSQRWKENLGYQDHEISRANTEWSDRIHPDDFDRVMAANQSYLSKQTPQYYVEYRLRCKDNSYKWMVSRGQAIWDEQGQPRRLVVVTGDISDRKRVEEERKQAAADLLDTTATLATFSNSLKQLHRLSVTNFPNAEALCQEYLRTGCEILNFTSGLVSCIEEQTFTIYRVESSCFPLKSRMSFKLDDVYCKEVVRQRKTIAYRHIGADEELRSCQVYQDLQIESYISTPVFVEEAIFGTLCFFSTEIRLNFDVREIEIIELMAQSIGKFMSAHLLDIQRQRAEEEIQLLLNITHAITAAADFDQALEVALRTLGETTNWIYGEIWLPSTDNSVLECSPIWYCDRARASEETIAAVEQFRHMLTDATFQPNEGIAGRVWSRQRPEWIPDVEDPRKPIPQSVQHPQLRANPAKDFGIKARFGVPITAVSDDLTDRTISLESRGQSTVVAVLVFFMLESRQQDERLIQLVSAVATQLGTVLAQKQAEAEMRALFSAMTDVVLVRDITGRCLKVMTPASPNLAKPPQEVLGNTLQETLPAPVADFILYGIQASLATRETVSLEYSLTIHDQEVWLSSSISPLSKDTVMLVARDVSVAKRSETARQRQEEALRLIVEGTAAKTGSEFLRFLVRYLAEVLQVRYAIVTQFVNATQFQVKTLAVWQGDDFGSNFEYSAAGLPCQNVLEGEVCYHSDSVSRQFPGCGIFTQLGVESYLGVPLTDSSGNVLGSLKVMDVKPMTADPSHYLILRIFAARAGAELERKLADDALRESADRERATLRIVERMRQSLELDQIFRAATNELRALLKCDRVAIYRFNPDWSGGFVAESVGAGWRSLVQEHTHDPALTRSAFDSDRCIVREWSNPNDFHETHLQESKGGVYSQGTPYLCINNIEEAGFTPCYLELLERFQAKAYVIAPIFQGSNLWGLMGAYQNSGSRLWKETETSLVIHISTQLGIALQQADLLSQTQHQAAQLQRARDAAEAASRAKSEFLSSMSHELRTPLNAILGFTQLMSRETKLSPDNRSNLEIINSSGQHLLGLINDVLEMSKIEAGRSKLSENSLDLYRLLDGLEEIFRLKANAKRLVLTFDRSPEIPQFIISDESKLKQVLFNLLGNAIKFTPEGGVTLRVRSKPPAEEAIVPSRQYLLFEIEDTGLGIAPEEMDCLFKPFVQTKTGQQSNDGTGLGLTLSQKFVNLMGGGNITVESTVDGGSIFRFEILVRLSQVPVPEPLSTRRVIGLAPDQPTYRLLIVEDQSENSQLLVKLLAPLGFEVYRAKNGQEALALWQSWSPHLILMDMRMPIMNGYEATEQIKATAKGQATVVIAVTGSAFEEDRSEILAIGCDDFIRKPFREEEIFGKLAEHLGVKYLYEAATPEAEPPLKLTRSDLEIMPEEWIEQLEQAASGCSDRQVFQLLEQIPASHAALTKTLRDMAYNFHFEEIVDLTNSAKP